MQTYKTEGQACPRCHHAIDRQSGPGEPQPGDLAVCLYCAAMLQMGDSLELKQLSESEYNALPPYAQLSLTEALERVRVWAAPSPYDACSMKLAAAAGHYVREHGSKDLLFTLPPDGVAFIGGLGGLALNALGANEKSREFLRKLDEATNHEATIMMAIMVIRLGGLPTAEATAVSPWAFLLQQGAAPS